MTVDRDEREDSQRVRWGIPPTVYVLGTCGVGCGDLVALRGLPTQSLFLYCDACGSAYPAVDNFNFEFPSVFAPKGIEFPSLAEVEAAFPKEPVGVRGSSPGSFWELIAETWLAAGDADLALSIAQEVIDTWHQAPKRAFEMRERALFALGDSRGSKSGA